MKKLIFTMVAAVAFAALADDNYQALYWQVTADSLGEYKEGATYANLYATTDGGANRVAVDTGVDGADGYVWLSNRPDGELVDSQNKWAINLSGWKGGSSLDGAMFFVELFNEGGDFMAQSAGISYADLGAYIEQNYVGSRIPSAATGAAVFGQYAVPEPTSGLLMLLGIAGLALRRKRA